MMRRASLALLLVTAGCAHVPLANDLSRRVEARFRTLGNTLERLTKTERRRLGVTATLPALASREFGRPSSTLPAARALAERDARQLRGLPSPAGLRRKVGERTGRVRAALIGMWNTDSVAALKRRADRAWQKLLELWAREQRVSIPR